MGSGRPACILSTAAAGEQGLGAGNEGDGEGRAEEGAIDGPEAVHRGEGEDVDEVSGDLNVVQLQVQEPGNGSGGGDAEQRSGNEFEGLRPEALPEGHDGR